MTASAAEESEGSTEEADETEEATEGAGETEAAATGEDETEAMAAEVEETEAEQSVEETEAELTNEESEAEMSAKETEAELPDEETEAELSEAGAIDEGASGEVREKSRDEVHVETEGEPLKEDWINSVALEVSTDDGWSAAQTENGSVIEVDADQMLKFHVTCTVEPKTLSPEMKTIVYQIPGEIRSVEESYGEIVDSEEKVLADYSIDSTGLIHITFTDEVAKLNKAGAEVTCTIEFRTRASNLVE